MYPDIDPDLCSIAPDMFKITDPGAGHAGSDSESGPGGFKGYFDLLVPIVVDGNPDFLTIVASGERYI
jgi:hypothetical protein